MRRHLAGGLVVALLTSLVAAVEPLLVCDLSSEKDVAAGEAFQRWVDARGWKVEFGTPSFFAVEKGSLILRAKRGPLARSWNPLNLRKREDKVILRLTRDGFRVKLSERKKLELRMAPVRLPGKGADVTDSDKNDACFYLLVGFDGPLHGYYGSDLPDSIGYVWADGAWKKGGEVGRDTDYDAFLRYLVIGRGSEKPGELRTIVRDVAEDFRRAYPERTGPVPDVVRVGVMIDSNTLETEAESILRSVKFVE